MKGRMQKGMKTQLLKEIKERKSANARDTFTIPSDLLQLLDGFCRETQMSNRSKVICFAIERLLEDYSDDREV